MRVPHSAGLIAIALLAIGLSSGCGAGLTNPLSPEVPGDQLTNPDPGSGVDGSFIPYVPPPDNPGASDPIPAPPGPQDLGLSVDNGSPQDPDGIGDPVYQNTDDGLVLEIDIDIPAGGSLDIDVGPDGNDGRVRIVDDQPGGSLNPDFSTGGDPIVRFSGGHLVVPLLPSGSPDSVYMSFTTRDANGNPTNESHGIVLPPGWQPGLGNQGGSGHMF